MATKIPSAMFAWRKHKGNPEPVWEEVPVPKTPPRGFLIKIIASGVCHSDHSLLTNENQRPWFQDKYTLGHEGCGKIIQIGDRVKDSEYEIGDRVATFSVAGCLEDDCPECSRDLPQLCERCRHSGIGQDGFYAPYAAVDYQAVVKVPDDVPSSVAAIATDAATTSFHAITRRAEIKPTETVFLFGLGGLGFNGLQAVRHIGARVIVSDVRKEILEEAIKLGVPKEDVVPAGKDIQEFIKENGLTGMIDTTVDFVGKHQTFRDAQNILRRGGKMVCIGTLDVENTVDMKIGVRKRLSIIFSYGGQVRDLREIFQLISKKALQPRVEEIASLKAFPTALSDLCDGKLKSRAALIHED